LALAAASASAQTLEVLGPSGPVPPDGFSIAVVKRGRDGAPAPFTSPSVSADGAELRPAPPALPLQTFLVIPRPNAREVRVRAADAGLRVEQRFTVGPPAERIELSLDPPAPVKGRDDHATLTVRLLKPDGSPEAESAPPVLRANVGAIEQVESAGAGVYRARYLLPKTRYPEVAILAALAPWPHPQSVHGVFGRLLVPLATSIDLPGHTEPNAQMSIEIAGARYGPVQAGPDGRFSLPVVVPPGHRFGQGLAVDRFGNKRSAKIDLMLPPTDQLACVLSPSRLPADGVSRSRVLCATSDPYGKPVGSARVLLTARRGTVQGPWPQEGGMLEWLYTAPRTTTFEPDALLATWPAGGPTSREDLEIALEQGPAARLAIDPGERLVHRGGELAVTLSVFDAFDRPRPGATLEARPSAGEIGRVKEVAPSKFALTYVPPEAGEEPSANLAVRAYGPQGSGPARLAAWIEGGQVHLGVTDLAGLPIAGEKLLAGELSATTGADGTAALGAVVPGKLEVSDAQWPGLRQTLFILDARRLYPAAAPMGTRRESIAVSLAPPTPVNVRLQVEGHRVTYWVEDVHGSLLPNRRVEVSLSGGSRGPEAEAAGRRSFEVATSSRVTVSVADVLTGVTALAEVRP